MKEYKLKRGNTAITTPIVLVGSLASIVILLVFVVNSLIPFIWYQKVQTLAIKYMYVIERFGYLTDIEYTALKEELSNLGFSEETITISCPREVRTYGELIELVISCTLELRGININKSIPLTIKRYSYSKI